MCCLSVHFSVKFSLLFSASRTATNAQEASDAPEVTSSTHKGPQVVIRGRVKEEGKSETFNKLWTHEEQRKLEELLIKYPPEEVESRRWHKIAAEMGNRTLHQVSEPENDQTAACLVGYGLLF